MKTRKPEVTSTSRHDRIVGRDNHGAAGDGAMTKGGLLEVIRQGDVLLIPIERGDPSYVGMTRRSGLIMRRENTDEGRVVVLAHGEATGHHHHVKDRKVVMRRHGTGSFRRRILHVGHGGATLEHQEHSPIALAPGRYEVRRQTEYTPPEKKRSRPTASRAAAFETRTFVYD